MIFDVYSSRDTYSLAADGDRVFQRGLAKLRQQAALGDSNAMNSLFEILDDNPEAELEAGEAEMWCNLATKNCNAKAAYNLGCMQVSRDDYDGARRLYRLAHEAGHPDAIAALNMVGELINQQYEDAPTQLFDMLQIRSIAGF